MIDLLDIEWQEQTTGWNYDEEEAELKRQFEEENFCPADEDPLAEKHEV